MKKIRLVFTSSLLLILLLSCTSADLYRLNYPDDPYIQGRMEKEYGDFPLYNSQN